MKRKELPTKLLDNTDLETTVKIIELILAGWCLTQDNIYNNNYSHFVLKLHNKQLITHCNLISCINIAYDIQIANKAHYEKHNED